MEPDWLVLLVGDVDDCALLAVLSAVVVLDEPDVPALLLVLGVEDEDCPKLPVCRSVCDDVELDDGLELLLD